MIQIQNTSPTKHLQYNQMVVGVTPTPLTISKEPVNRGILVVADLTNTDLIYIGGNKVTVLTGWPLLPGEAVEIPVDDASSIYCVANQQQNLSWIGA